MQFRPAVVLSSFKQPMQGILFLPQCNGFGENRSIPTALMDVLGKLTRCKAPFTVALVFPYLVTDTVSSLPYMVKITFQEDTINNVLLFSIQIALFTFTLIVMSLPYDVQIQLHCLQRL